MVVALLTESLGHSPVFVGVSCSFLEQGSETISIARLYNVSGNLYRIRFDLNPAFPGTGSSVRSTGTRHLDRAPAMLLFQPCHLGRLWK